jgi:hypothetical protein
VHIKTIVLLLFALPAFAVIDLDISPADVDRALAIGRKPEAETASFHVPYIRPFDLTLDGVTVRQVEVLTPFRRIVQFAEQRRRLGDYVVSRADVDPILAPWRTRVSLVATVRFHPQNILTSIPPIDIVVRDPVLGTNIPPLDASRKPIMNAGTTRPILGATIEIIFDAGLIANLNSEVIVSLRGKELVKTTVDFRRIE